MVVNSKNGKTVIYFNSTNKPKNNNQTLSTKQINDESEFEDSKFRRWQKKLAEDSKTRIQRNSHSILESDEQKRIRKMMNSK